MKHLNYVEMILWEFRELDIRQGISFHGFWKEYSTFFIQL